MCVAGLRRQIFRIPRRQGAPCLGGRCLDLNMALVWSYHGRPRPSGCPNCGDSYSVVEMSPLETMSFGGR